jgi:hypothetical protein
MIIPQTIIDYAAEQDALRHHAASPENVRILVTYQNVFESAIDAHAAGKVQSRHEAIAPLLEISGLVQVPNLHRDFLNG